MITALIGNLPAEVLQANLEVGTSISELRSHEVLTKAFVEVSKMETEELPMLCGIPENVTFWRMHVKVNPCEPLVIGPHPLLYN